MDKFSSVVGRMLMELGDKFLNSLRNTQVLERFCCVGVVDGATHAQKDGVESNGNSLKDVAEIFVLFMCGTQLVMRPSILNI
jgi:hypothetical protein